LANPISQYVLKVHGRCDLACDHCYVFEHADQSFRTKPRALPAATADIAARRISEHAAARAISQVTVILHGGEPLLLGRARMRSLLDLLVARIAPVTRLDLRVHSNGVLLDEQWCDLFSRYGVMVGISLDGDKAANDRHRRFADGRSSYEAVLHALTLLRGPDYRHLYAGILCTIDLRNDPVTVYRALADQEPAALDFLLPHATWEQPPYRPAGQRAPYADWLMRVYRCWDDDGRTVPVRIFRSLVSALAGGPSFTESLGTDPADLLVIDTDGAWEQPDSMKTAFDGAPATGMSVFAHGVDEVAAHPAVAARQSGVEALCAVCQACPVVQTCGGGLYAHRFRRAANTVGRTAGGHHSGEFDNPSVYCADLKSLIDRVAAAERARVAPLRSAEPPQATHQQAPAAMPVHTLAEGAFERLAAGPGDIHGMRELAGVKLSMARMLTVAVATGQASWRDRELRTAAETGWALLCELERDHQDAVQATLAEPHTAAWAWRCLHPPPGADRDLDRAHLAGVAAAVALRAGVPAHLPLPVRNGLVHLPTVGAVAVPPGECTTRRLTIRPGARPKIEGGGQWQRVRHVTSPPFERLSLEDLDPFRDCQEWPAAGRLPGPQEQAWRRRLASAGRHLAATVPDYARVLGLGLRSVVPLRPAAAGDRSATARHAFGAVALALPGPHSARGTLSELLLHEFQHAKLYALLDLYSLVDAGYRRPLRVGWRPDPRPAEGVLHGAYAYLALSHLRRAEGKASRATYLRYRSWVAEATAALLAADALTPAGRRFVSGMADAAASAA
jgi:uncharacterized protein